MFDKTILDLSPFKKDLKNLYSQLYAISAISYECYHQLRDKGREGFQNLKWFYDKIVEFPQLKNIIGLYPDENGIMRYAASNVFNELQSIANAWERLFSLLQISKEEEKKENIESYIEKYIVKKDGTLMCIEILENNVFPSLLNIMPFSNPYSFFICSLNTSSQMFISQYPWIKELSEVELEKFKENFRLSFRKIKIENYSVIVEYISPNLKDVFSEYSKSIYIDSILSERWKEIVDTVFSTIMRISNIEYEGIKIEPSLEKILDFYALPIKEFCESEKEGDFLENLKEEDVDTTKIISLLREKNKKEIMDLLLWLGLIKVSTYKGGYYTIEPTSIGNYVIPKLKERL